ncbi:MAG: DUF2947 domain-containing protein [Burkholderiaceae bacterium]|nr:DUF2947 domain-containing protein [Burkholderiaceae bacterium]
MYKQPSSYTFRKLDSEKDWSFFDKDFAIPQAVRQHIHALNRSAAEKLWSTEVSNNALERHVMLLPKEHWLKPEAEGPNWLPEWERTEKAEVDLFLRRHFQLSSNEAVYFLLMREIAYQAPIEIAIQHWRAFLALDDEGPLLLHLPSGCYALFGPDGYLQAGNRRLADFVRANR